MYLENPKYLDPKQHTSKELMGQQRNKKKIRKYFKIEWKWKHNMPIFVGCH